LSPRSQPRSEERTWSSQRKLRLKGQVSSCAFHLWRCHVDRLFENFHAIAFANPIENVWEYLRGNKLAITIFDDYDDIVDKACEAWNFFKQDLNRIASITTRIWATVNN
jgi:hypothetical protein